MKPVWCDDAMANEQWSEAEGSGMFLRLINGEGLLPEQLPLVLSVEEAAHLLRISRSAAYEQARRYRDTGGKEGLPVISLGRSVRVPRAALLELLGEGPKKDASSA